MTPFHQMLIIVLAGIMGFLVVIGIIAMVKPDSHSRDASLPAEVIAHSKEYVESLGARPFDELKTNEKLLLMHSYYNLGNYNAVIQCAETMIEELRKLPPERKSAFMDIIERSYYKTGQDSVVIEFRKAVGS